jgi:hypothetical protein
MCFVEVQRYLIILLRITIFLFLLTDKTTVVFYLFDDQWLFFNRPLTVEVSSAKILAIAQPRKGGISTVPVRDGIENGGCDILNGRGDGGLLSVFYQLFRP